MFWVTVRVVCTGTVTMAVVVWVAVVTWRAVVVMVTGKGTETTAVVVTVTGGPGVMPM